MNETKTADKRPVPHVRNKGWHKLNSAHELWATSIWVVQVDEDVGVNQNYGIAWWYGLAPDLEEPNPSGDFDEDGDVDGNDLSQWEGDYGGGAACTLRASRFYSRSGSSI